MRHGMLCIAIPLFACQPRGPQGNTGPLDGADADTDADADSDADADLDGCAAIDAEGIWEGHPIEAAGATLTYDAYTFDAGLGAARTAAEGATKGSITVDIPVAGAVVLAKGYAPGTATSVDVWLGDQSGAMYAYDLSLPFEASTLQPGDVVSLQITQVNNYFGTLEITGSSGLTVDRKGDPVRVVQAMTGAPITYEALGEQVIEVWGELIAGPDTSNNFELEYPGGIITFRTFSAYDQVGDCIHWIGPLTQYFDVEQLNADDYDWYRSY